MKRAAVVLALAAALARPAGGAAGTPSAPRVDRVGPAQRVEASVGGSLVAWALPRRGGGTRSVSLLVRPLAPAGRSGSEGPAPRGESAAPAGAGPRPLPPCDEPAGPAVAAGTPLALYRMELDPPRLELVRDDLPHDATALGAADLDGDGRDEMLLVRPGELLRLDATTRGEPPAVLLREAGLRRAQLAAPRTGRGRPESRAWVAADEFGGLALYAPVEGREGWERLARVDLPLEGSVGPGRIRVTTPRALPLGADAAGTLHFASPPKASGRTRVQTTLVAVARSGETIVTDCWGRLPAAEEILDSSFLFVDDRPVLLLATKPADKLGLFDEKRLRLYPLERDRSRLGLSPLFEVESRANLWQEIVAELIDVNGDGREDLVLGYWKGLLNDRVVLDVYLRRDDGFDPAERHTALDVKRGDRSFVLYGTDLTGDGRADLLVRGKPGLLVYPGRSSGDGRRLVEDRPVQIPLFANVDSGERILGFDLDPEVRPDTVDLDGDGVGEILVLSPGGSLTPVVVSVLKLPGVS